MARTATPRRGAGARRLPRSRAERSASETAEATAGSTSYEISAADLEAAKWLEYTVEKGLLSGFLGDGRSERPTSR